MCLCNWREASGTVDKQLQEGLDTVYEEGLSGVVCRAIDELDAYFRGGRKVFDAPLLFVGTDFQKKVWSLLAEIPYGQTLPYGAMAARLGMPKAVRAVANATEPMPSLSLLLVIG